MFQQERRGAWKQAQSWSVSLPPRLRLSGLSQHAEFYSEFNLHSHVLLCLTSWILLLHLYMWYLLWWTTTWWRRPVIPSVCSYRFFNDMRRCNNIHLTCSSRGLTGLFKGVRSPATGEEVTYETRQLVCVWTNQAGNNGSISGFGGNRQDVFIHCWLSSVFMFRTSQHLLAPASCLTFKGCWTFDHHTRPMYKLLRMNDALKIKCHIQEDMFTKTSDPTSAQNLWRTKNLN